jgi:coniferyl-aldehyde dehydrogenase
LPAAPETLDEAQRRGTSLLMATTKAMVYYQPLGVVGIVVPWNYPIAMSAGPLVFALAAGNRVMVKMSETTPRTAELMRHVLSEAFEERQVAVVLGEPTYGARVHPPALRSPAVHRRLGRRPAGDARGSGQPDAGDARARRQVADADLRRRADGPGGRADLLRQGAERRPDLRGARLRALPRARVDEFVDAFGAVLGRMYPGWCATATTAPWSTSAIPAHQGLCGRRACQGAEVIELNPGGLSPEPGSRKLPLYLIKNATRRCASCRRRCSARPADRRLQPPAGGHRFHQRAAAAAGAEPVRFQPERRARVLAETHAGGVCINDAVSQFIAEDLPFGGVGESGMGHYHGYEGFLTFSHQKAVFQRPRINTGKVLYAPHGGWLQRLLYRLYLR